MAAKMAIKMAIKVIPKAIKMEANIIIRVVRVINMPH